MKRLIVSTYWLIFITVGVLWFPCPGLPDQLEKLTLEQVVESSDAIVIAKLQALQSGHGAEGITIPLQVQEFLKGDSVSQTLLIKLTLSVSGINLRNQLHEGYTGIFFLSALDTHDFCFTGGPQGVYLMTDENDQPLACIDVDLLLEEIKSYLGLITIKGFNDRNAKSILAKQDQHLSASARRL